VIRVVERSALIPCLLETLRASSLARSRYYDLRLSQWILISSDTRRYALIHLRVSPRTCKHDRRGADGKRIAPTNQPTNQPTKPTNNSEQGPGPRSCHKMCFDAANKRLYTLGRYVDPENSTSDTTPLTLSSLIERSSDTSAALQLWSFLPSAVSIRQALAASAANDEDGASGAPGSRRSSGNAGDFYCYDIPSASWICLSSDTMVCKGVARET